MDRREFLFVAAAATPLDAQKTVRNPMVELVKVEPHPYGVPRPFHDATEVPLRTSIYLELTVKDSTPDDVVDPNSVEVDFAGGSEQPTPLVRSGQRFGEGCRGSMGSSTVRRTLNPLTILSVYIELPQPLAANTRHTIHVRAVSTKGAKLGTSWSFTTEEAASVHPVRLDLDLKRKPVHWHGAFFSGSDKTSFGSDWDVMRDTYELMNEVHRRYPKAFSLERDNHLAAGHLPDTSEFARSSPNLVREQETRHIVAIQDVEGGTELKVEDFFGHEQYGIASNRPLSGDYHPGDTVLVADARQHAKAKVIRVSDRDRTVLLSRLSHAAETWKPDYTAPLPVKAPPDWPGLFPKGGCYLFKFDPAGTPRYYWGRVDSEWDTAHRKYGRRFIVSLTEAPGDLSVDGRHRTTAKDYLELHQVMHAIADRIIKRYGKDAMDFYWFVFGEPDLGILFWRTDWMALQTFYDYTVDAVLRAFEDNGLDSSKVKVGGLGLAASNGMRDLYLKRLRPFLIHCSPTASTKGEDQVVLQNAAFADERLKGRRSRRVEQLCRDRAGRGSPCDFISIHCYDGAKGSAGRLKSAKALALEVDPRYYDGLWVLSDACCPGWHFPPDQANRDSYAGNGYFATWAVDMARRQLAAANADARFAYGETAITLYPEPDADLAGTVPAFTCRVGEDTNGDGKPEHYVTLKQQIFHVVEILASMGADFLILPEVQQGHHTVSGFASQHGDELRIVLYSHNEEDVQVRSEQEFAVKVTLTNFPWPAAVVTDRRIDREHNSYFPLRKQLGKRAAYGPVEIKDLLAASRLHETGAPVRLRPTNGVAELNVTLACNGMCFLVLQKT